MLVVVVEVDVVVVAVAVVTEVYVTVVVVSVEVDDDVEVDVVVVVQIPQTKGHNCRMLGPVMRWLHRSGPIVPAWHTSGSRSNSLHSDTRLYVITM
jgi:hypothetical protein